MEPTLGMPVHFFQGGRCYAAIVVRVWTKECVNLYVLPTGSDEPAPGDVGAVQQQRARARLVLALRRVTQRDATRAVTAPPIGATTITTDTASRSLGGHR